MNLDENGISEASLVAIREIEGPIEASAHIGAHVADREHTRESLSVGRLNIGTDSNFDSTTELNSVASELDLLEAENIRLGEGNCLSEALCLRAKAGEVVAGFQLRSSSCCSYTQYTLFLVKFKVINFLFLAGLTESGHRRDANRISADLIIDRIDQSKIILCQCFLAQAEQSIYHSHRSFVLALGHTLIIAMF